MPKNERRIEVKAMLPPLLVAKAKAIAKEREISYSEFVEEALTNLLFQEFLNDAQPKKTPEPMITGLPANKAVSRKQG